MKSPASSVPEGVVEIFVCAFLFFFVLLKGDWNPEQKFAEFDLIVN